MTAVAFAVFALVSVALAAIDHRTHRLPDAVVLPALAFALPALTLAAVETGEPWRIASAGVGAASSLATHLAVHLLRPSAWGGGDVKLAALIGAHTGWVGMDAAVLALGTGAVLGAAAGAGALSIRRSGDVALGPALIAGGWWGIAAAV